MRRCAFTLVELLVVIGIIAVLLSILLPALSRAREHSMRIQCMSNHKQLMYAFRLYTDDWKGTVPFMNSNSLESGASPRYGGPGWLYWYRDGVPGNARSAPEDIERGTFFAILRNRGIFRCPFDQPPYEQLGATRNLTSYLINNQINHYTAPYFAKVTQFKNNAIVFWEVDDDRGGGFWNDGCNKPDEGLSNRHGRGRGNDGLGIVSCIDGHAEWISVDAFNAEAARTPSRLNIEPAR